MKWKDLLGKTIKRIDDESAVNVVTITFTDKSKVVIDTEKAVDIGTGIFRPVPCDPEDYKKN